MTSNTNTTPICLQCKNYLGSDVFGFQYLAHTCTACPEGIPSEVLQGDPRVSPANADCVFVAEN